MLSTKQPVLRRFWYSIMPVDDLKDGPKPFVLMGEKIVLFLDGDGKPAALEDRCCHRTAQLSKGWCKDGNIVCGYHGWEYDRTGKLVMVPQFPEAQVVPNACTRAFHCAERYGYVWVALDDPIADIPTIPEDGAPGYRRIHQFYERWDTSPFRLMENSFDAAHIAFVHRGTFGNIKSPKPDKYSIEETDDGFVASILQHNLNPPRSHRITGETTEHVVRNMRNIWYMPFCRRMDIAYPSGLRHIVFNCATPIDDGAMQLTQILYRNDTEEQCTAQELIDWDAAVVFEDKEVLESTDPEVILDSRSQSEMHMVSDRPGMIMRKRLLALLTAHGEEEVVSAGKQSTRLAAE